MESFVGDLEVTAGNWASRLPVCRRQWLYALPMVAFPIQHSTSPTELPITRLNAVLCGSTV
jgi:hypothetical protein